MENPEMMKKVFGLVMHCPLMSLLLKMHMKEMAKTGFQCGQECPKDCCKEKKEN